MSKELIIGGGGVLFVIAVIIGVLILYTNSQNNQLSTGMQCPPCPPDGGGSNGGEDHHDCNSCDCEATGGDFMDFLNRFGEQFKGALADKLASIGEQYGDDKILGILLAIEEAIKKKGIELACGEYKDVTWEKIPDEDIENIKREIRITTKHKLSPSEVSVLAYIYIEYICNTGEGH